MVVIRQKMLSLTREHIQNPHRGKTRLTFSTLYTTCNDPNILDVLFYQHSLVLGLHQKISILPIKEKNLEFTNIQ